MGNGRPCHRDDLRLRNSCQSHVRAYADSENFTEPPKPTRAHPVQPQEGTGGTVTFLSDWRLSHLPPDTRPLPSVAHYDQFLKRHGRTAGEKEGS
ncbi:hypothetical protein AB0941_39660 [Streptomyces sp. NPDC013433]|uniref:hypothetical protein n=1 Tax=Streptomyces sp. NPDC013433 TaxID=3155604 RepID=UPI003457183B